MSAIAQLWVVQTRLEPPDSTALGQCHPHCGVEGLESKPSENLLFPAEARLPAADLAVAQGGRAASSLAVLPQQPEAPLLCQARGGGQQPASSNLIFKSGVQRASFLSPPPPSPGFTLSFRWGGERGRGWGER